MPGAAEEIQASLNEIYSMPYSSVSVTYDESSYGIAQFSPLGAQLNGKDNPFTKLASPEVSSATKDNAINLSQPPTSEGSSKAERSSSDRSQRGRDSGNDHELADISQATPLTGNDLRLDTDEPRDKIPTLRVYPCFKISRTGAAAADIIVTRQTVDVSLFSEFRHRYFSQKSWLRRFCELREVSDIKFVMVCETA